MKNIRNDKKEWVRIRDDLYNRILDHPGLSYSSKRLVVDNKFGLYETPKVFDKDGYAYNDGTWKKFSTGCCYGKQYRGMMMIGDKKSLGKVLYAYICFLRKLGVEDSLVVYYFVVLLILDKLDFKDGMFPAKKDNINMLERYVKTVFEKCVDEDICCDCDDERKFCMSDKLKSGKSNGVKSGMVQVKKGELTDELIEKYYDPKLTKRENLKKFEENGLVIKERRLQYWKKKMGVHL